MPTTIDETFDTTPSEETLCEQIARAWAARTSGGAAPLTFCEPDGSTPANLYACAMPQRSHRLAPGISVTPTPTSAAETGVLRAIGVNIEVRDATMARCIARLRQVRSWLLEEERSIVLPRSAETILGQKVGNVIGRPPGLTVSDATSFVNAGGLEYDLWAIVSVEPLQSITPVFAGGPGNATEEGEAMATMSLTISAYPVRIRGPVEAIAVTYAPPGGIVQLTRGEIRIVDEAPDNRVLVTSNDPEGIDYVTCEGKTIGQLATAIDALAGWSFTVNDDVDVDTIPANDLLTMASQVKAYIGGGGEGPVSLCIAPPVIDRELG